MGELTDNLVLAMAYLTRKGWVEPITGKERFNAQGLEGKACIPLAYGTALDMVGLLPRFRFRIVCKKGVKP